MSNQRVTERQVADIIEAYTIKLVPMIAIAKCHGFTRQGIYKILHKAGVDTSNKGGMIVSCSACGKEIVRPRAQVRKAKHIYCSVACYADFISASNHKFGPSVRRMGNKHGRKVMANFFPLQDGHIVHHIDGNVLNNDINNLMVFRNAADHCRHHRGFEVNPLFP